MSKSTGEYIKEFRATFPERNGALAAAVVRELRDESPSTILDVWSGLISVDARNMREEDLAFIKWVHTHLVDAVVTAWHVMNGKTVPRAFGGGDSVFIHEESERHEEG